MLPDSLRAVLDRRSTPAEPRGIVTATFRDGNVLRQSRFGDTWRHFTTVPPIHDQPPTQEDDDNPFPP